MIALLQGIIGLAASVVALFRPATPAAPDASITPEVVEETEPLVKELEK